MAIASLDRHRAAHADDAHGSRTAQLLEAIVDDVQSDAPLPRKLNRALLQMPGRLRDSVGAAGAVLDRVRAEVVVGFGGYVAGRAGRPTGSRHRHREPVAASHRRTRPTRTARHHPAAVRSAPRRAGADGHRRFAGRPDDQRRRVRRCDRPVLTDPERIAAHATAAGTSDADIVLARHVLNAVAKRRMLAS